MTSLRRALANRTNSLQSTGPRTPSGKAVVSMNAITHGLCSAKHVVHIHENHDEFDRVRDGLMEQLDPQTPWEQLTAERIIATAWRLRRVPAIENWLYWLHRYPGHAPDPSDTYLLAEPWRSSRDFAASVANVNRHEAHLHRLLRADLADYRAARQANINLKVNVAITPHEAPDPVHPVTLSNSDSEYHEINTKIENESQSQ